jgi:uncharacterized damage-inducible protein DinB
MTETTSTRAGELAERFEQAAANLLAEVEPYTQEQWLSHVPSDNCSVAAVVSHVAGSYRVITGWAKTLAEGGQPPAVTMEQIHQGNAAHAEKYAERDKAETLEALRNNAARAAEFIRALSDEQLSRRATFTQYSRELSAGELIDEIMIGHAKGHLQGIQQR